MEIRVRHPISGSFGTRREARAEVKVKVEHDTHYEPDLDFSPTPEDDASVDLT